MLLNQANARRIHTLFIQIIVPDTSYIILTGTRKRYDNFVRKQGVVIPKMWYDSKKRI